MAKIGIVTFSSPGHLNPSLTVATELANRKHEVTFYTLHDAYDKIVDRGFRARPYGTAEFGPQEIQEAYETLGKLSGYKAVRFTVDMMKRSAVSALSELPGFVREDSIDGLVVDQLTPWGGSVARAIGIPYVNICNALPVNIDSSTPPIFTKLQPAKSIFGRMRISLLNKLQIHLGKPIVATVNEFHQQHGLDEYKPRSPIRHELAEISQIPARFDFPNRKLHDRFHYVAPFHSLESRSAVEFPWEKLTDDKPIIYASMGTIQNRMKHVFETVAKACEPLAVQLVISLGGGANLDDFSSLAGDPIVVHYAPQLELLKRSAICITHAGMNTTLECLAHGVPMLAIPVTNDQPGVSTRIEHHGVGRRLSLGKLNADEVRADLQLLLSDSNFRNRSLEFKEQLASMDGPALAADIIETAFMSGVPVTNPKFKSHI
jgi:MGT family glycosyltransferase